MRTGAAEGQGSTLVLYFDFHCCCCACMLVLACLVTRFHPSAAAGPIGAYCCWAAKKHSSPHRRTCAADRRSHTGKIANWSARKLWDFAHSYAACWGTVCLLLMGASLAVSLPGHWHMLCDSTS